jgi:hypothetical protein
MSHKHDDGINHDLPEQHERDHHIVSPKIYVVILLALLVGTALTV